jgi:putative ABC transport system permease protein
VEQAQSDLSRLDPRTVVTDLHSSVVGSAGEWLMFVLVGVGFLLLVAWVNVANVLLARATQRVGEIATRTVLGASRRRLFMTSLIEGFILVAVSFAAGTGLAVLLVELAQANLPEGLARASAIAVDGRVLLVSAAGAGICALVFAAVPAWLTTRPDLSMMLKTGGGAVGGSRGQNRALKALLVVNVSFVCVLLVASTLVVYTFVHVSTTDLGFDRTNIVKIQFDHSLSDVPEEERAAAATVVRSELIARARSVAGVVDAAIARNGAGPLSGSSVRYSLTLPGVPERPSTMEDMLETNMVSPNYFSVMGMQLVRGRLFAAGDHSGAPNVMLINEAAAQKFFEGRNPVGLSVSAIGVATVVGVLKSVRFDGPEREERPAMYFPIDQMENRRGASLTGSLVVRTTADPRGIAPAIREALGPSLGLSRNLEPAFLDDSFARIVATRRFNAFVMGMFGLIAALIGAIGVFGTTTYFVAQQVPAIGIRMALGATPSRIRQEVLGGALTRVAVGIAIGLAGAYAVSHLMEAFVFGIRAVSPGAYLAVASLLIAVTTAAAMVPATRAAKLDPLTALRIRQG